MDHKTKQFEANQKANRHLSRSGYNRGGAIRGKKKEDIGQEFPKSEKVIGAEEKTAMKKAKGKYKEGGKVEGEKSHSRLDKYARGGKTKSHAGNKVNIIVAPHSPAMGGPMAPVPGPAGMPPMAAKPPMPAPPPGVMPGGGQPRPPGIKRGGKVRGEC